MRFTLIVTTAMLAACASGPSGSSSTPGGGATQSAAPAALGKTFSANLIPTGSTSSRLSGTITLTPSDVNSYSVAMEFRSGPKNTQLPWAIRPGGCGDATPNSDIGSRSAYGPIQTQADGSAHVNTRIRVQLPEQLLHADVMQSNSQRDVILSCGVLVGR